MIVGNPIMHHLVLGIDPTPLGMAPFTLATSDAVNGRAGDLDLDLPFAVASTPAPASPATSAPTRRRPCSPRARTAATAMQLVVDVGTNAEIVLGNRERQLAASSPTGPAFEGAQISCGQRATAGAVESVRIDPDTLRGARQGDRRRRRGATSRASTPAATTGVTGLCGSGIIDLSPRCSSSGSSTPTARSSATTPPAPTPSSPTAARSATSSTAIPHGELSITQNDVRAVQLAKAALRAGIDLLLEHAGDPAVTDIRLAGAFGAHIDPLHAMVLGLVPDCPLDGVRSVGNAAGAGAVMALLSASARREMEAVVRGIDKIETATEPRFQELFVAAMAIPHATAPSDDSGARSTLPARTTAGAQRSRRRRS